MSDCISIDEAGRLEALYRLEILDSGPEEAFDRITRMVRSILQMPMSVISFIDRDRQWFKSHLGVGVGSTPRGDSFCTHTIRRECPLIVGDASIDERFQSSPLVTGSPYIRFYAGVPLRTKDGQNVGALCAMDTRPREVSSQQIEFLQDLAKLVVDEMELRLLAGTDSLTGAMSRRQFFEIARGEVARAQRYQKPLSCLALDVDYFKKINDQYGHAVGDIVLQRIATALRLELRDADYVGRLGGEEFAIMLPETSILNAMQLAERLLDVIAARPIEASGHWLQVTASIGVASYSDVEWSVDRFLHAADIAMYDAKKRGRNRVVCYLGGDLQVMASA